jgi:hypothetical protein
MESERETQLYIVSGCTTHFFIFWILLYKSIKKNLPNAIIHFYDLGLSSEQVQIIKSIIDKDAHLHFHTFDFSLYPEWVNVKNAVGQWAWKPQCIKDVMDNYVSDVNNSIIMWCDSCNIIDNNLSQLISFVKINGVYSNTTRGSLYDWTRQQTMDYLNAKEFRSHDMRNAALPMFYVGISWVQDLINDYAKYSLVKECIFPEGSSRANHRQDQSVLSCLYYTYWKKYHFVINDKYMGISIHRRPENFIKPYSS